MSCAYHNLPPASLNNKRNQENIDWFGINYDVQCSDIVSTVLCLSVLGAIFVFAKLSGYL